MLLLIDLCTCHWLIPWLLPFLLGLILGWLLWGKLKSRIEELEASQRKLVSSNKTLEAELETAQAEAASHKSELSLLSGRLREREVEVRELSSSLAAASQKQNDKMYAADLSTSEEVVDDVSQDVALGSSSEEKEADAQVEDDVTFEEVSAEQSQESNIDDIADNISEEVVPDEDTDVIQTLVDTGSQDVSLTDEAQDESGESLAQEFISQGDDDKKDDDTSSSSASALGAMSKGKPDLYAVLKRDDLQIVEGIGPKMNEVLGNAGVNNWEDLASKSTADIRAILDSVNHKRYRIIDPAPWPEQAKLAMEGKWDENDLGRKAGATGQTDSKVEKLLIKLGVLKRWKQNDLTAIEGVGPKISGLLKDAGIDTWRELANAEVSKIQEILDAAGKRYKLADPSTWPKQAEMAADGRWDDLSEYQDFLQGGK